MKMKRIGMALVALVMSLACLAQEEVDLPLRADSLSSSPTDTLVYTPEVVVKKEKKNIFRGITNVMDHVTDFFMGCDTAYITPQLYEFTAQLELSNWNDFYHMQAYGASKSMDIMSDASTVLGGYLYWSIFGYGYSVNLRDVGVRSGEHNGTGRRQSFVLNTGRFFAEYYTFNSGKTARITRITGQDLKGLNTRFHGLQSWCTGVNFSYIFNHNHYSWPAAFGENAVQRKSCGSFKAGFTYNNQRITLSEEELPEDIVEIDSTLLFSHVDYTDYAINFGYAYNWVFRRNCLLAISLTPALGYRKSNITESDNDRLRLENLSTDLFTKASLFWNNTHYFAGVMLEFHTYHYRKKNFGLTNNYGTLKFIVGLNFLKKSQYKEKRPKKKR